MSLVQYLKLTYISMPVPLLQLNSRCKSCSHDFYAGFYSMCAVYGIISQGETLKNLLYNAILQFSP